MQAFHPRLYFHNLVDMTLTEQGNLTQHEHVNYVFLDSLRKPKENLVEDL